MFVIIYNRAKNEEIKIYSNLHKEKCWNYMKRNCLRKFTDKCAKTTYFTALLYKYECNKLIFGFFRSLFFAEKNLNNFWIFFLFFTKSFGFFTIHKNTVRYPLENLRNYPSIQFLMKRFFLRIWISLSIICEHIQFIFIFQSIVFLLTIFFVLFVFQSKIDSYSFIVYSQMGFPIKIFAINSCVTIFF